MTGWGSWFRTAVTLKGNFLDRMKSTEETIWDEIRNGSPSARKNGQTMIALMKRIVKNRL